MAPIRTPRKKSKMTVTPHPLEDITKKAFEQNAVHDATSLAYFLAGANLHGKRSNAAYRTVALDILGYMTDQGLLYRDASGWWRMAR